MTKMKNNCWPRGSWIQIQRNLELDNLFGRHMKELITEIYLKRLRLRLTTSLNDHNLIFGVNTWVLSLARHSRNVKVSLSEERKSYKHVFFLNGSLNQNFNRLKLYTLQKERGWGNLSLKVFATSERRALNWYFVNSEEILIKYWLKCKNLVKGRHEEQLRIREEGIEIKVKSKRNNTNSWRDDQIH